ncbi:arfaptin-2 [Uranotaenia lowii]|uniref:arfaptin-2 n=1 Tax=Uranotaenia lowii TaxID=190385 RepID=UPI002479D5BA|nr:arfaptin-2 [Uranotaenia lowii]
MSHNSEKSIHEMLKASLPSMNDSVEAVHSGTPAETYTKSASFPMSISEQQLQSTLVEESAFIKSGSSALSVLKNWSISTYKCTKQLMLEKMGKCSRTVDMELESQIEQLRDTQKKYLSILRLTRLFSTHFYHCVKTQQALAEAFSDLAQKSPELQEEFLRNSETQRSLTKNGELLLNALNFFTSSISTLCNKTIEDTIINIRQYEAARIEFDAYRIDLANSKSNSPNNTPNDDIQVQYEKYKTSYEKLRADVAIKMQLLDENRIKVMHKQLILLHNAIAAYYSGNAQLLESTLQQFNVKLKSFNTMSSWLEQ